ncbi:MAG TPA: hypothetical protein VL793_05080 [Patescibacteria group bacterium]|nr:hypothetical protein [Patescibacteria group bacterium]
MKVKVFFGLLGLFALLCSSGCVIREDRRGGDWDHHWRGYGHEEHWEHDHDWH